MNRPQGVKVPGQEPILLIPATGERSSRESASSPQSRFRELEMLARWLDSIFHIPGSKIRFGLDALLGLIPGLGDTVTSAASLYILVAATRMGVPRVTVMRMAANIGIDYVVGSIPLLGDFFDVFWKANQKNVELLSRNASADQAGRKKLHFQDWLFLAGVSFVLISILVGSVTILYWLWNWIFHLARTPAAGT